LIDPEALLGPVSNTKVPLVPEAAKPVVTEASPLDPAPNTSLDCSCRDPDPVDTPLPVEMLTLPPVPEGEELDPAIISTEPPTPDVESPTARVILPADPPYDEPVDNTIEPEDPVLLPDSSMTAPLEPLVLEPDISVTIPCTVQP
jgi:hypothetical protein